MVESKPTALETYKAIYANTLLKWQTNGKVKKIMSLFGDINLKELFDNDSDYGKQYRFDALTDDMISRAEETLGYKLPKSYIELLNAQNGGLIDNKYDSWLTAIYGIGPTEESYNGLENMFENWKDEWQYPDIGIPFGETRSGGHDMYYMDYGSVDENGEPRIVRIDNEGDIAIYFVADNLVEFIKMVFKNQEIQETLIKRESIVPDTIIGRNGPKPSMKDQLKRLMSKVRKK